MSDTDLKVGDHVRHSMYGDGKIVGMSTTETHKDWPVVTFEKPLGWFGVGAPGMKPRTCQPLYLTKIGEPTERR
jgi:hypothetical protein